MSEVAAPVYQSELIVIGRTAYQAFENRIKASYNGSSLAEVSRAGTPSSFKAIELGLEGIIEIDTSTGFLVFPADKIQILQTDESGSSQVFDFDSPITDVLSVANFLRKEYTANERDVVVSALMAPGFLSRIRGQRQLKKHEILHIKGERTANFERQHVAHDLTRRPSRYTEPYWP